MTKHEWNGIKKEHQSVHDILGSMEERGRLQENSIDQMSKLI